MACNGVATELVDMFAEVAYVGCLLRRESYGMNKLVRLNNDPAEEGEVGGDRLGVLICNTIKKFVSVMQKAGRDYTAMVKPHDISEHTIEGYIYLGPPVLLSTEPFEHAHKPLNALLTCITRRYFEKSMLKRVAEQEAVDILFEKEEEQKREREMRKIKDKIDEKFFWRAGEYLLFDIHCSGALASEIRFIHRLIPCLTDFIYLCFHSYEQDSPTEKERKKNEIRNMLCDFGGVTVYKKMYMPQVKKFRKLLSTENEFREDTFSTSNVSVVASAWPCEGGSGNHKYFRAFSAVRLQWKDSEYNAMRPDEVEALMTEDDFQSEKRNLFGVLSLLFVLHLRENAPAEMKSDKWQFVIGKKMCLVECFHEFCQSPSYGAALRSRYVAFLKQCDVHFVDHVVDRVLLMPDLMYNWRTGRNQQRGGQNRAARHPTDCCFWINEFVT